MNHAPPAPAAAGLRRLPGSPRLPVRAGELPVVTMCGPGITACHNLPALELAARRTTRLHAGSWSEWIADPARPVASGEDT